MTNVLPLFLDVLPVHPQPQPFESLNSYIKRLAIANGIRHINTFSHLAAIREPRFLFRNTRLPSFGRLATLAGCTEAQIWALTFYHLGRKFSREQTLGRFLAGSAAPHIRYCPHCLAEKGYYALGWSFLQLSGCPEHGTRLLDGCGHCGQPIALTVPSLSITDCPWCGGDLRRCVTQSLTPLEHQACLHRWDDLVYLLVPQPWEGQPGSVAAAARQRLGFARMKQGWLSQQVAQRLEVRKMVVIAMDNEPQTGMGETFRDYLHYADYLGVTLSDLFKEAVRIGYISKEQLYEDDLLAQTQQTIATLKQQGIPVTQERVGSLIGRFPANLRQYPRIHALLREEALIREGRTLAQEQALYRTVQQTIDELKTQGKRISRRAIGLKVGWSPAQIRKFYPSVDALLTEAVAEYVREQPQRERRLEEQVRQAVEDFKAQGRAITYDAIAQHVGISSGQLSLRPQLHTFVNETIQQVECHRLATWVMRTQEVIAELKAQGRMVTRRTLADEVGIYVGVFDHYPPLKVLWEAFAQDQRCAYEDDLVLRVQQAAHQLETQQQPVTLRAIERIVGMARGTLKRYPRVYQLFDDLHLLRPREPQGS